MVAPICHHLNTDSCTWQVQGFLYLPTGWYKNPCLNGCSYLSPFKHGFLYLLQACSLVQESIDSCTTPWMVQESMESCTIHGVVQESIHSCTIPWMVQESMDSYGFLWNSLNSMTFLPARPGQGLELSVSLILSELFTFLVRFWCDGRLRH